jgi:pteridine reductase
LKNEPLRVLVTGGGVRLGRALALAFAAEGGPGGVAVAVHHRSSAGPAAAVVAQIEAAGGRAVALQADLSTASGCAALAAQTEAALGGLDVLINSAADYAAVPFAQLTPEAWDAMQAVNTRAPFLLTQALLPALQASGRPGGGCVINLTDIAADRPVPGYAHYCVSKAGLTALTRALALELAPAVRVNAIAPGTVLAPRAPGRGHAGGHSGDHSPGALRQPRRHRAGGPVPGAARTLRHRANPGGGRRPRGGRAHGGRMSGLALDLSVEVGLPGGPARGTAVVSCTFGGDAEALAEDLRFLWSAGRFGGLDQAAWFAVRLVLWSAPAAAQATVVLRSADGARALHASRRDRLDFAHERKPWGTVDVVAEVPDQGLYRLNVAPGQGIPEHFHRSMQESERVVSPGLWGWMGQAEPRPLLVGTRFDWPAELAHGYRNPGAASATILCLNRPRFVPEEEVETGRGLRALPTTALDLGR